MTERRERPSAHRWGCALLLLCTACGGEAEPAPPAAAAEEAAAIAVTVAGDTVPAEPYRSPPGFPLAFHTVVPEGFTANEEMEGPGAAIRFTWAPRGQQRDSSFVYVRVMDEGTTEGAAREIVRTAAERVRIPGNRTELEPRGGHPWAVVEYPIRSVGTFGEPVKGWVALGARGRWFYVIAQSPVEAWPRFEPPAEVILSRWRWADAGGRPGPTGLENPP
ncbi:MAG: hypothetical protein KY467_13010 [Gemmatimonadetes bacterium]|nr:hypothetical protein [Gemmatimonadota bacterium]